MMKKEKVSPPLRLRTTNHPVIYEVNTRIFLSELSESLGKKITLSTIPDSVLDDWAERGFDAIWLMGVWTTGNVGMRIALEHAALLEEYKNILPDFTDADVIGSPYAVKAYMVSRSLGGNRALQSLRKKLVSRGIGLILDFVSNHTARDHSWIKNRPEFYVQGQTGDDTTQPASYFAAKTVKGEKVIAFGKDPYFPGWSDTAQLNARHPETRSAIIDTLLDIGALCDGVRCDMAMLLLNDVFVKTWGEQSNPVHAAPAEGEFWNETILRVKQQYPDFLFIAEAYWDKEWELQQLGFDFTYDKIMYDRLLREGASSVYDHLKGDRAYQHHCLRFIENHDEPRIAHALPNDSWQLAAAVVAATVPGMMLFHEGQSEGRKIRVPVQLGRRPFECVAEGIKNTYANLLSCLKSDVFRKGEWSLLNAKPAWQGNSTWRNFLGFWWSCGQVGTRFVVVNFAPHSGQCYFTLPIEGSFSEPFLEFKDMMGPASHSRERNALATKGMYFDLSGYGFHIFEVVPSNRRGH